MALGTLSGFQRSPAAGGRRDSSRRERGSGWRCRSMRHGRAQVTAGAWL